MPKGKTISVIGAGSWGTALAILLSAKGHSTTIWGHENDHIAQLQKDRENKRFLPGHNFPEKLNLTADLEEAMEGSEVILMVVPSHVFRNVFKQIAPFINNGSYIVTATKGIENETLMTMTQVMENILGHEKRQKVDVKIGVLSGPSFADEVAKGVPTAVTIAFEKLADAKEMQGVFVSPTFRVYASQDVTGLELCGAMKNVIAIAAGVCDGLGYGLNTRAALITRGLAEMKRLGTNLRADPATFSGLSGLGDLVLTCTGNLSRNRSVGLKLGKGLSLERIVSEMDMVAEGVKTTMSIYELARKAEIEMPIVEQMYEIIYKNKSCKNAVNDLLTRELKVE